jgi:hypothetical protein
MNRFVGLRPLLRLSLLAPLLIIQPSWGMRRRKIFIHKALFARWGLSRSRK